MRKTKFLTGAFVIAGMLAMSGCAGGGNEQHLNVPDDDDLNLIVDDVVNDIVDDVQTDDVQTDEPADDISGDVQGSEYDYLYSQYYDIVAGLDDKWDMFQFIDLTVEDFPSILITSSQEDPTDDLQNYMLLTFSNAGAVLDEDSLRDGVASAGGYRGTLYYVPNSGTIYEEIRYAPYNNPSDKVYLLDNGQIFLYASGYTEPTEEYEGPEDTDHLVWFWNSEEVGADDYESSLKELTQEFTGVPFFNIEYVDKATMLSQLEALK